MEDQSHNLENGSAMSRSTSDMSGIIGGEAPNSPDLVLDLTAEEMDFINDREAEHLNSNHNNGSTAERSIPLDDDTYAFFVEAGLDDPEELAMLGIDIDEIRNQKSIADRLEQQIKTDAEAAAALQREFELARHLPPSAHNNNNVAASSSSSSSVAPVPAAVPQATMKRELDNNSADSAKRPRIDAIELTDDDDCIDLTEENDVTDITPIPVDDYNNNYFYVGDGYSDEDENSSDMEEADYLSFVPWNRRPHNGMPPPPFTGGESSASEYHREEPDFHLFEDEPFGYHVYGSHMSSIARDIHERRNLPPIINRPMPPLNSEQTEKELKELLENIQYDDPPPPEARQGTPEGLSITLLEHQKIGFQWMLKMENSNSKGGILADDMGLGKTIQALATIVANPCEDATEVDHSLISRRRTTVDGELKIKATLIVCPVSLIDQWRREIESKTEPRLKVLVYHGSRTSNPYDLALYDVIISSYAITASNFQENRKGPFAHVKFHRIVLDEAHTIKNKATRAATGCCAVDATYRWCMTATPIQNKIDELYSLIKFLRIRPFCEWEEFRDCISKPMKNGDHKKAVKVAHVLMKAISMRRSKKAMIDGRPILNLPQRNVHMTHIDFSPDERNHYDFVNQTAQARFNKYMQQGTVMKNYSSVLVLLLRLRQACLHPSLTLQEGDVNEEVAADQEKLATNMKPEVVRRLLSESATLVEIECPICMDIAQNAQIIVGCGHILCKECFDGYWNIQDGNRKNCPQCRGELDSQKLITIESFLKKHAPDVYEATMATPVEEKEKEDLRRVQEFISSAKIEKMMEILDQTDMETDGRDKTIVFSQFTGMLDLIERPLREKGFKHLRYDGSMDIKQRAEAVNQFFDDPEYKVLLVSTKAGSLGLNLTVANRVILLDVWWNPALENQAIDRVHRIGQEKNVEVHRIFINDTVEDRILQLQDKKQAIADGVLGEGSGQPMGRLGLQEMIYLFRGGEVPDQGGPPPANRANAITQAGPSNMHAGPSSSR